MDVNGYVANETKNKNPKSRSAGAEELHRVDDGLSVTVTMAAAAAAAATIRLRCFDGGRRRLDDDDGDAWTEAASGDVGQLDGVVASRWSRSAGQMSFSSWSRYWRFVCRGTCPLPSVAMETTSWWGAVTKTAAGWRCCCCWWAWRRR